MLSNTCLTMIVQVFLFGVADTHIFYCGSAYSFFYKPPSRNITLTAPRDSKTKSPIIHCIAKSSQVPHCSVRLAAVQGTGSPLQVIYDCVPPPSQSCADACERWMHNDTVGVVEWNCTGEAASSNLQGTTANLDLLISTFGENIDGKFLEMNTTTNRYEGKPTQFNRGCAHDEVCQAIITTRESHETYSYRCEKVDVGHCNGRIDCWNMKRAESTTHCCCDHCSVISDWTLAALLRNHRKAQQEVEDMITTTTTSESTMNETLWVFLVALVALVCICLAFCIVMVIVCAVMSARNQDREEKQILRLLSADKRDPSPLNDDDLRLLRQLDNRKGKLTGRQKQLLDVYKTVAAIEEEQKMAEKDAQPKKPAVREKQDNQKEDDNNAFATNQSSQAAPREQQLQKGTN